MKKIFDFGKKKLFPPCPPLKLPNFFGVQTSNYIPGYVIQNKDLRKIHKAALLGDVAKVQHLLMFGKNSVNEADREKRTCLHLACANGHLDVVSLLIERKCELNLLDRDSRTPFMKAIQCEEDECATLLLEHGADPNLGDGSNNALHYVAFCQSIDMAAKLLQYKADIEAKNKEGLTPLFFAIRARKFDMAEFLLKNGANVNALDGYKRTTLMIAVSMQFTEMVSLLLEYNVDHTMEDQLGRTAEAYARTYNYPLHAYVKQIEKHMERNKPCTSQISCSKKTTVVPGFVLKASSLNKKVAEKSSTEESISRLSEKPRPDDPCPSTKDELNFEMEKLPKLKLTKSINAAQHMTKIKHMDNIVYTKVTPFYEDNQSLSDIEDPTDSFPKSSSQAQSHDPIPPAPAYFAKSSLMKSTLLDIFNEDSEDSEKEKKKSDVLVDARGKKIACETQNILYPLQAHKTSEKCAVRKALEEDDDTVSSWDSEEYPKDSEVEEKKSDMLVDNNTSKETTSETPHIPSEQQAHSISEKSAARKRLEKEEDTKSLWDSKYTPGTLLEVNARCTHAFKNQNIKGSISLEQHEDLKENSEYKGSSNRSKKRLDPRSLEQYTPGTVLEVDPSLTYGSENQNIKDGISLEQYEDIKENSEYKESSDRSKERFDPRSLEQYTPETVLEVDPRLTNASKNQNIKGSISLDEHEDLKENSEYKGSSDRSKERFDPRSLEQFAPGIVLGVDSRLTRASKNQNIKGSISLEQQKNLKQKLEFKGSSDRSKEHFDARHQGQHAPGSILERVTRLIRVWRNQKRKCCISLAQQEEVGKIPLNKVKTADSSTQAGSGSDTGSKDGVILEKRVPKKPSEPPVQQEEAKQKLGKSPLKDGEAAESSAQAGSGPDTDSKDGVPKTPAEPHVQKEEAKQNKKDLKPKSEFKGSSDRSKESFDKRYLGKYAPGSVLERVIRLLHAWKNQYRKGGISLGHHEEVGKSPLKEDETAELSTQGGSGSDTGCKVGVVLEKLVPKKPSEPPVQKEEAKQSKKEVGKSPLKEVETAEASVQVGSGSDTDSKVGVVLEKPVPKKPSNPLVQKEEAKQRKKDVKGELKLKGLSNGGQEGFSNSDQKQDKVTLETPSIPEKTASKKQVQSLSNKERMSERPESNRKSDSEMNSKESCKITWIEEEKKVKNNNLIDFVEKEKRKGRVTVLQTFSGQTEQDREYAVSHNLEMTFQENILLCSQNSTLQHKNDNEPEMESICKVNEEDVAYLSKNVKRAHINIYVNKMKEDRSFDIEMAGSLQRNIGNLEPHSGGLLQSSATGKHFTHSGDMKSTIQEKKPEIITARKCKEKTKHKETLFKNSHHNDSNSIDEPRCLEHSLPYRDKMSKNYLDAELNQHTQRLTIELEIMQTKFLTLEKEKISPQKQMKEERKMEILERKDGDKLTESRTSGKINKQFSMESHQNGKDEENKIPAEKSPMSISSKENLTPVHHVLKGHAKRTFNENNKDKGEMSADTLDDITQSCEIDTENSTKDSDYIWEKKKVLPIYEPVVKFTHSQWTRFRRKVNLLEKMIIGLREELSERMETKYQLKNRKAECDRKLYRSRLEGEKLQTQIHYPSCTSSAVLEHKSQTSKLNLQQQRDKWLFLKDNLIDKIDILSIQLSKVEDETYQVHNALRMKTLLLEQTQRQLKEFKDKLKQLKNENHIQKKKMNRLFFKEKALQEKLAQMQKKIQLLQKPFEDSQNKAVFISKGVQVQFKDSPMTFCTATAKKDPALEKRNKESVDDICVSLREKLRKLENENSKNKDTIRKLRKKLGDSQKKQLTTLQEILSHQTVLFLKQKLQEKVDETTHKLQKSQEEDKQKLKYLKERKDYIQKLKMERATFEDAIKQQMDKTEKLPKQFLEFLIKYDAELQQQLDAVSSTNRHVESINRHLQEETIENLKQKYDRLDLMHHLEIPMDQIQYGPKIKEKVKKKFNPLLKIQQLKAKFHKRNIVHQELKAELERYRKLFSQEYRFTTGPFLEPMNNEFVDTSVVLPRRRSIDTSVVLPRRRSINFTENTESSENSTEDCFSTIQQAKENSVAKSDDDISELPSTSRWASPIGYTRRPNLNWDPVSRPT